jgi:hypothetical protein
MLGPSLTLALVDVWNDDGIRKLFWDLALALAGASDLPAVARLAAPMVVAELVVDIGDLEPLLLALKGADSPSTPAMQFLQKLLGALFVRFNAGVPLTGPEAGPWMELADRVTETGGEQAVLLLRPLIARATDTL